MQKHSDALKEDEFFLRRYSSFDYILDMDYDDFIDFRRISYEIYEDELMLKSWKNSGSKLSYEDYKKQVKEEAELRNKGVTVQDQQRLNRLNAL